MQDKRWLGEAIINDLDNAIKYSPEHSKNQDPSTKKEPAL